MGENNGMIKVETHKKDRFNAQKSMKERKLLHERGMRSEQPALPCRPSNVNKKK